MLNNVMPSVAPETKKNTSVSIPPLSPLIPRGHTLQWLVIVALIIFFAVGVWYLEESRVTPTPQEVSTVSFMEKNGVLKHYSVSNKKARAITVAPGYENVSVPVIEAGHTSSVGVTPVLVTEKNGTSFGVLRGSQYQALLPATNRYGLVDSATGIAYYVEQSTDGKIFHLYEYNFLEASSTPIDLGPGFGVALVSDGTLIALVPEGVARISPLNAERKILINVPQGADGYSGAIAPDGSAVAYLNPVTGTIDLFTIKDGTASYRLSITPLAKAEDIAFSTPSQLAVRSESGITLYNFVTGVTSSLLHISSTQ